MRRDGRGSRYWPWYAKLAEEQGTTGKTAAELVRLWHSQEKRRIRRMERREAKRDIRNEDA